jgi:hypothetical protein
MNRSPFILTLSALCLATGLSACQNKKSAPSEPAVASGNHPMSRALINLFSADSVQTQAQRAGKDKAVVFRAGTDGDGETCGMEYMVSANSSQILVDIAVGKDLRPTDDPGVIQFIAGSEIAGVYEEVAGNAGENVTTPNGTHLGPHKIDNDVVSLELARLSNLAGGVPANPFVTKKWSSWSAFTFFRNEDKVVIGVLAEDKLNDRSLSCDFTKAPKASQRGQKQAPPGLSIDGDDSDRKWGI